jgi:steroid 5-alpha reductase family enzyme
VSFGGIHLFPTAIVFAGCLPLWAALATGDRPLGALDALAAFVTLAGIAFEFFADNQLRRFRLSPSPPGAIHASGLWRWSRHPNYFGEILFWWGLALFGLAAAGFTWWIFAGAAAITALFVFVSLPLIETRMRERRPGWAAHASRVSLLLPLPPRGE